MVAAIPARLGLAALAAGLFFASADAAQPVVLKNDIVASGPAITLSDFFANAGPPGARAVAPAPVPGASTSVSTRFLSAAAAAAGLSWTPPSGMDQIVVTSRGGSAARPRQYAALAAALQPEPQAAASPATDAVIRRGDLVTLVYVAPGLQLTTRAKALADADQGGPVRLVNLQSNRVVDATAMGPGEASANPGQSF